MKAYWESIHESLLPKFAIQLFTILEDIRIEEKVKKERPGTKKLFDIRQKIS